MNNGFENPEVITKIQYLQTKLAGAHDMAARNVEFPPVYKLLRDDVRYAENELQAYVASVQGISLEGTSKACEFCENGCTCISFDN